jgi:hypothetical protein
MSDIEILVLGYILLGVFVTAFAGLILGDKDES